MADLPQQFAVGEPATFDYAVRQHGHRLTPGLQGHVTARSGLRSVTAPVSSKGAGRADLSDKRYSDVLLAKLLADPSILPPSTTYGPFSMPDLQLRQPEIAALVAFINAPGPTAARVPAR